MEDSKGTPAAISAEPHDTLQIQSAIDQLTYLQRILNGDDEMSLTELLASTSASGPSSSLPSGGLSKALPALLSLLLPVQGEHRAYAFDTNTMSRSQNAHLAKAAAFQPRKYLDMTSELITRTTNTGGEMYRAIHLAQSLLSRSDSNSISEQQKERILQDRKRRKIATESPLSSGLHSRRENSPSFPQSNRNGFTASMSFKVPSALHGHAKELERILNVAPDEEVIRHFLKAWEIELSTVDLEASNRIQVTIQHCTCDEIGGICLLRVSIEQTGFAWLWVKFVRDSSDGWLTQIHRVNVLAESEVEGPRERRLLSTALRLSKFPLYRSITSLLFTKFVNFRAQQSKPWSPLVTALFATSTLCRLHEIYPPTFDWASGGILRGQENILKGLIHLEMGGDHLDSATLKPNDDLEKEATEQPTKEVDREETQIQTPQSALFSDRMG